MQIINGDQLTISADEATLGQESRADALDQNRFSFGGQRWKTGLNYTVTSILSLCSGTLLATHVPEVDHGGLTLQIDFYLVATILLATGVVMLVQATRNLFGGFSVTEEGLTFTSNYFRSTIPWSRFEYWESRGESDARILRLLIQGKQRPEVLTFTSEWLSLAKLNHLERLLRRYAASVERKR